MLLNTVLHGKVCVLAVGSESIVQNKEFTSYHCSHHRVLGFPCTCCGQTCFIHTEQLLGGFSARSQQNLQSAAASQSNYKALHSVHI